MAKILPIRSQEILCSTKENREIKRSSRNSSAHCGYRYQAIGVHGYPTPKFSALVTEIQNIFIPNNSLIRKAVIENKQVSILQFT